jgi:CheY-like chemotaxis protein
MIHILLVEDDTDDQLFFKESIEKLDLEFNLSILPDAKEINDFLTGQKIDLIFLDINLPVIDGVSCLISPKSEPHKRDIPVIMFTISDTKHDIERVYSAGAHYYLIKPLASINYVASLKKLFSVNWKSPQPIPDMKDFVINYSFTSL